MPVWLIRAGRYGETESLALDKGVAVLGWDALPDLSMVETREDLMRIARATYPHENPGALNNWLDQVWAFCGLIQVGDVVVLPFRNRPAIAVGRISGPYQYRTDLGEGAKHTRHVEWLNTDMSPEAFDKDLIWAFGAFMTVARIACDNADKRIMKVLDDSYEPQRL